MEGVDKINGREILLSFAIHPPRMRWHPLVGLILLSVVLSSAGYVDIETVRDMIVPPSHTVVVYEYDNVTIEHTFVTTTDPESLQFSTVVPLEVRNGSQYIDVRVKVEIPELPSDTNLSELLEMLDMERVVNVTLFTPDNEMFYTYSFNKTTPHTVRLPRIQYPSPGTWHLKVEAEGMGNDMVGFHDSFTVQAIIYQPASQG